jgi:hypothetical protein
MKGAPNGPCEFWAKVDRSAGEGACWPWIGHSGENGYGQFSLYGRARSAHAVAAHFSRGDSLAAGQFDHLCHDPNVCDAAVECAHRKCCNPDHLELVAARVNILRSGGVAALNSGKSHCKNGHPFDEANTLYSADGRKRTCRTCKRAWEKRNYERRRLRRLGYGEDA